MTQTTSRGRRVPRDTEYAQDHPVPERPGVTPPGGMYRVYPPLRKEVEKKSRDGRPPERPSHVTHGERPPGTYDTVRTHGTPPRRAAP